MSDVLLCFFLQLTSLIIQDITFCKNLWKCTFAIICDSVNLPPRKKKFTPGVNFPRLRTTALKVGYICLSEGVHSLYICNNLTLRHKNGVYLYSSEIQNYIKNSVRGTWLEKGWEPLFYKLGLLGQLWAYAWAALLWNLFFHVLRHNAGGWSCAQTLPLSAPAIVVTESDISKKFMLNFLQVSCSSNERVVQQERSNCIVSSIRLSVRFDWRTFALALAAPLQSFLYNFRFDYDW